MYSTVHILNEFLDLDKQVYLGAKCLQQVFNQFYVIHIYKSNCESDGPKNRVYICTYIQYL
jgi:hypothetical protein